VSLRSAAQVSLGAGDRLLSHDPARAGQLYLRSAELTLAGALLEQARTASRAHPLRALALLRRCESLGAPLAPCQEVAARAYLALGQLEVARAFAAACGASPPRRPARPWRAAGPAPASPAPARLALSVLGGLACS